GVGINGHIAFNEAMDEKLITADKFKSLKTRMLRFKCIYRESLRNEKGGFMVKEK
ncbi:unnamed protein product, partial [marine sediment metagenome]